MPSTRALLLAIAVVASAAAQASETYIFKDENGVQVIANAVPPHLARNGYRVVDSATMRTIRVVPAEASNASSGAGEDSVDMRSRRRTDEQLLALYTSVGEVTSTRDRKLHDLDVEIERIEAQIDSDRSQRELLSKQTADAERSATGGAPALRESVIKLDRRIEQHTADLERRRREREAEALNFEYEVARVTCLSQRRNGGTCAEH